MKELLYFTAPWCKSCANVKPLVDEAKQKGIAVQEVNVEEHPEIAQEHDIMQLPTVIMIQDESVVSRKTGFSNSLIDTLRQFIGE